MSQRRERSRRTDLDGVSHWLIHHAAHRAPESLSSRLEEEWLAGFECRSGAWAGVRFAVGWCWGSLVIVGASSRGSARNASISARGVVTHTDPQLSSLSL